MIANFISQRSKLKVFALADELVIEVYRAKFPAVERFGLQAQLRRAAVSVAANVIEGCARRTTREYTRFINIALAPPRRRAICSNSRIGSG